MNSPMLSYPVKFLDMCPRSDGACAVIFATEEKAKKLCPKPAWVHCSVVRHDYTHFGDLEWKWMPTLERASAEAYKLAGITNPLKEFDVAELYLPCSTCGVKWMDSFWFCEHGRGARSSSARAPRRWTDSCPSTRPAGSSPRNPIGATALIRVGEAAWQIMGKAGDRQVPNVKKALCTGFGGCSWSDVMILGADLP